MTSNHSTIGRKRKKNGFTQVSNQMLEDERLSWRAKGLLCYMLSRPDNWKINRTDLYRKAKEGRDAMSGALNELKELNYLHIYPNVIKQGQIDGWVWEYSDEPFSTEILENQTTENPQENEENEPISSTTGFQYDGFPVRRDSSIYNNTDFNNTDFNKTKDKEIIKEKVISTEKPSKSTLETEFERFWQLYPRKTKKQSARESFVKARKNKKVSYETIEKGLYSYITHLKQQETDEQFITHGSTWLNQERWQDEYIATGFNKKPKDAMEYFRAKYSQGEDIFESNRNGEIIDYYPENVPEFL